MSTPVLSVRKLVKRFGGVAAVDDLSLDVQARE
ncbi:MAG: ABC transporter ATP-binding protein, partial [Burkholderiaceae bacterium]|nr:ABC transporter ATP-binding protein [Burkholderiaceae bacterium]